VEAGSVRTTTKIKSPTMTFFMTGFLSFHNPLAHECPIMD
jgi:hypothetical protein